MIKKAAFFSLTVLLGNMYLFAQNSNEKIRLNQLGFYTNASKIAVITDANATNFYIVSVHTKDTVFKAGLSEERQSMNSSVKTRIADFSALKKDGDYIVEVPGAGRSYPFKIGANVNRTVAVAALKGFYYQRVSMPLEEKYAGKWARPAGHPDTAVLIHPSAASAKRPAGTVISSPGGWYDAGDYNKYIVNSGITMGTLLSAYEDFSGYYDQLNTNIPESNDAIPDLLNEIVYNLRWMLTMQDPNDGGVYHKCTNAAFDGMVMPGVTKLPRYAVQKGTAATLDFAAVMAQASRIFQKYKKQLPGLSDSCLNASLYAWKWAEKNPDLEYDQNAINKLYEPKITTGAYGDKYFSDEWFWAASELFVTTNDKRFYVQIEKGIHQPFTLPSWGNVHALGYYTLLRFSQKLPAFAKNNMQDVKQRIFTFADTYLKNSKKNAFQTVMGQSPKDFNWGSNANAANQGILLINAYLLSKDKNYLDGALSNLDYLLGRNATGYCFVTGIGSKSPMHPHHRPSVADGIADPVPGLLAGGPNPGKQDGCKYEFSEPETCYVDADCSYASNEITINWNAPLVYLANAMEYLQKSAGY